MSRFLLEVPATTANLGPGFDCLGLALDYCNEVIVDTNTETTVVAVEGEGAAELSWNEDNLFLRALQHVYRQEWKGEAPPVAVQLKNRIPLGRGLGSSAATI